MFRRDFLLRSYAESPLRNSWLNLEPFITPSIFEPHLEAPEPATDEWTLSVNLGEDLAEVLEHHYDTFIVRELCHMPSGVVIDCLLLADRERLRRYCSSWSQLGADSSAILGD